MPVGTIMKPGCAGPGGNWPDSAGHRGNRCEMTMDVTEQDCSCRFTVSGRGCHSSCKRWNGDSPGTAVKGKPRACKRRANAQRLRRGARRGCSEAVCHALPQPAGPYPALPHRQRAANWGSRSPRPLVIRRIGRLNDPLGSSTLPTPVWIASCHWPGKALPPGVPAGDPGR